MTGAPIDSSIRKLIINKASTGSNVPSSPSNLDPAPQVIMTSGSEQYAFQYEDGLGDGRDTYDGYNGAGDGANVPPSITVDDFISFHIESPKNKIYYLATNVPIPVQILNTSHVFGTGSATVSFTSGTVNIGGNITMTVSGVSIGAADLRGRVYTRTSQD